MNGNGDEVMPLEDALRIIMKVPPQEPCDEDTPTPDGDDFVDADEEDSGEA